MPNFQFLLDPTAHAAALAARPLYATSASTSPEEAEAITALADAMKTAGIRDILGVLLDACARGIGQRQFLVHDPS